MNYCHLCVWLYVCHSYTFLLQTACIWNLCLKYCQSKIKQVLSNMTGRYSRKANCMGIKPLNMLFNRLQLPAKLHSVNDRPSITSAASVAKQMYGSSMVKSAQDLERKLMPWKHASVILCPCRLMVPPITVPRSGSLQASVDSLLPQMCSSTCCQWRWWRISDIHVSVTYCKCL